MVFKVITENLANRSLCRHALLSLAFTWSLGGDVSHLSYDLHKINDLNDLLLYLYINRTMHNFRLLLVIRLSILYRLSKPLPPGYDFLKWVQICLNSDLYSMDQTDISHVSSVNKTSFFSHPPSH